MGLSPRSNTYNVECQLKEISKMNVKRLTIFVLLQIGLAALFVVPVFAH